MACEVPSIDPRIGVFISAHIILPHIYEGLMRKDLNGNIVPGVCESYKISKDGLTFIFSLRKALWSNGDPVTAYDFEYSWKKCNSPQNLERTSDLFYFIKNAKLCQMGQLNIDALGVKAIDDKTLIVELEHPADYFLEYTSCIGFLPISKKMDQEHSDWYKNWKKHAVFNGAFKIKSWCQNYEFILEKNDKYWDKNSVKLPGINFHVVEDSSVSLKMFQKGNLDFMGEPLCPIDIDELKGLETKPVESNRVLWLWVNQQHPILSNKNFRKAFSHALNRKELATLFNGKMEPTTSILGKGLILSNHPYFHDNDLKKAKQYLKEALKDLDLTIKKIPTIRFSIRNSHIEKIFAQAVQQQIHNNLGINIELKTEEVLCLQNSYRNGSFDIGETGWHSFIRDPIYILDTFRYITTPKNYSRWENQKYQQLLEQSDHEIEPKKRNEILKQAEEILVDDLAVIPLFVLKGCYLKSPKLKDVYMGTCMDIYFHRAYLDE